MDKPDLLDNRRIIEHRWRIGTQIAMEGIDEHTIAGSATFVNGFQRHFSGSKRGNAKAKRLDIPEHARCAEKGRISIQGFDCVVVFLFWRARIVGAIIGTEHKRRTLDFLAKREQRIEFVERFGARTRQIELLQRIYRDNPNTSLSGQPHNADVVPGGVMVTVSVSNRVPSKATELLA